jgi:DNA-binding transcriptional LysR family regulator
MPDRRNKKMQNLETNLNASLLVRTNKGVLLTET